MGALNARLVFALCTTWLITTEVLASESLSPLYTAVMLFVPVLNAAVVNVATPLAFTAELPSVEVPSINFTVPVGMIPVNELTVAVKVTDALSVEGFSDEVSAVVVFPACTVWFRTPEVPGLKFPSPP